MDHPLCGYPLAHAAVLRRPNTLHASRDLGSCPLSCPFPRGLTATTDNTVRLSLTVH